jgi:flagellin-like protein
MNTSSIRMKSSKKGVTPVIATIILIAGTLVLALVVGAYTFGLFGSNVKTVTLSSATLYGGTENAAVGAVSASSSYVTFSLNNPGSASSITGITLTGAGISSVTSWETSAGSTYSDGVQNNMAGGQVTSYTFYPVNAASQTITTGQVYNYVIAFANGQSVSGSLIAQ